jgi:hypothetical protein
MGFVLCGADLLQAKGTYDRAHIVVMSRDSAPFTEQMKRSREALPVLTIVATGCRDYSGASSTAVRQLVVKGACGACSVDSQTRIWTRFTGNWAGLEASRMVDAEVCFSLLNFTTVSSFVCVPLLITSASLHGSMAASETVLPF